MVEDRHAEQVAPSAAPQPVHVVHVIARLNVGGPAAILDALQSGADDTSFRHTILAGRLGRDEASWAQIRGTGWAAIPIPGLTPEIRPLADLRALITITRRLRQLRPDIVHTHTAKAGVIGRLAAMVVRIPVVHTFHGHVLTGYFSPAVTRGYVTLERWLARGTRRLICVGQRVGEQLREAGIGELAQYRVVRPSVPPACQIPQEAARTALDLSADDRVVLVLGRLAGVKRVDRAIEVARRLLADDPATMVLIAGGGELEADLRRQAVVLGDRVRFLGWVADVAQLFAAADIILLTSDNEGMPVGLIEAASAGLPAVATDVGSVAEVVLHGETGLVVPTDVSALVAACKSLLADEVQRQRMGALASRRAADHFSAARLVQQHEDIYREVLT